MTHCSISTCSFTKTFTLFFQVFINETVLFVRDDTDASVTLLHEKSYLALKDTLQNFLLELQRSDLNLSSVQGSTLHVIGALLGFYTQNFMSRLTLHYIAMASYDFDSITSHNINVSLKHSAVLEDGLFPTVDAPTPLLSPSVATLDGPQQATCVHSAPQSPRLWEDKRSSFQA